jgi:hypothetical protein
VKVRLPCQASPCEPAAHARTHALPWTAFGSVSRRSLPRHRSCWNGLVTREEDSVPADQASRHDQVLRDTPSEGLHCSANRSRLYNSNLFSDVTISFSGRNVKAHRVVLCGQSAYFDKLCNPESGFMVSIHIPRKKLKALANNRLPGSERYRDHIT